MKYYITGTRRGLGQALEEKYGNCDSLEECDIFINCKHNGFDQVDLLYKAARLKKRIINISSNSGDSNKKTAYPYAVQKIALDKANEQLYYQGINTTSIRFGYFDSPRVGMINANKMSIEYCVSVIDWVLNQPHKVKDITITPE
jgi:NAD(P)-dependent dehydrogenase (short-subunit alcohol dehydrogenase family)